MTTSILLAVVGAGILYLVWSWWHNTRDHEGNHWTILLDGFPIVHIPSAHPRDKAWNIASLLKLTYTLVWDRLLSAYSGGPESAAIAVIGCSDGVVDESHPNILWPAPRDKIFMKVQPTMYYWFARELHNVFRYQIYGIRNIYKPVNDQDAKTIADVEAWIDETYRRSE